MELTSDSIPDHIRFRMVPPGDGDNAICESQDKQQLFVSFTSSMFIPDSFWSRPRAAS
jgi:hypothetical protein